MYGHEGRHANEQVFIFSFSPSCQSNEIVLMHGLAILLQQNM